ncbi:hypothetical protein FGIG_05488 [Fasciola gigantica]|uniref:Uncharacterized protein n=1 Tax=Fasciola gigantica TaxID=46835 RepID=A0A504YVC9_FASGI|nr:hypothetical protein FGIG_05488 [Fasciola gigantica]
MSSRALTPAPANRTTETGNCLSPTKWRTIGGKTAEWSLFLLRLTQRRENLTGENYGTLQSDCSSHVFRWNSRLHFPCIASLLNKTRFQYHFCSFPLSNTSTSMMVFLFI